LLLEPPQQALQGLRRLLQLGGSGFVGFALGLDLLHGALLGFALRRQAQVLAAGLAGGALHLRQVALQASLQRLHDLLAVPHALEEKAILLRHHDQVVPARQELPERLGGEQELELARRSILVERAQTPAEALALVGEQAEIALQIHAGDVELGVESLAPVLQLVQALAADAQLALGALELADGLVLLTLEPRRRLSVLAGASLDVLQLAPLGLGQGVALLRARRGHPRQAEHQERGQDASRSDPHHHPRTKGLRREALARARASPPAKRKR